MNKRETKCCFYDHQGFIFILPTYANNKITCTITILSTIMTLTISQVITNTNNKNKKHSDPK